MWETVIPIFLHFTQLTSGLGDGAYECGDHGRFEYCIDEIPGCVIGCHCHPGFYFDTDTKICEPNSRLIEHHRRNNVVKPTRVQKNDVTPNVIYDPEPPSSTSKIDGRVDEITKDANDLGDWLYNQFFKTIENQVINNTNDKDVLTRRSGLQKTIKEPKSKKWRKREKPSKQKGKKKQLRRKLLRITENDSLFDISSKSSSDSSDSSSGSDLSSMELEYEEDENNHHKHDDDEHGHKKIVMINRKPKQPLPSFIFLPNLDTPFYPPIGLPPPPIVPMYPMVPVPPVALCPIQGCDENVDKSHVATTSTAPITTTISAAHTTSITTVTSIQSNLPEATEVTALTTDEETTTNVPKTDTKALRIKNKKKKKKAGRLLNNNGKDTEQGINSLKYINRQQILQRLKEKMNNTSGNSFMPSWKRNKKIFSDKFINRNIDAEIPIINNGIADDEYLNNEINPKPMEQDETFPDNVDFKYISELIHRVDLNNKSNNLHPVAYNPIDSIELYQSPNIHKNQFSDYSVPFDIPDGRRINRPRYQQSDESYYANLGRQIAKMIRSIDTKDNVKLEQTPTKLKNDPYLNNSPKSFWERSVRSPLAYLESKNKKYEYLKRSNELLFDIENKVEIIASAAPALTLQEIENIVKIMEAAKREIQHVRTTKTSKNNFNIDLWPQKSHNPKNSELPYLNKIKKEKNVSMYKTSNNKMVKPSNNLADIRMHSIQKFVAWNSRNFEPINETHNIPTTPQPSVKKNYVNIAPPNYNLEKSNKIHQIPVRNGPFSQNIVKQSFLNHQVSSPYFMGHRKYFQDNYNYYLTHNDELPVVRIAVKPSYFPEINQFGYIE